VVRRLIAVTLLLGAALAQEAKPLFAGGHQLEAHYPLGRGVSYTAAKPLAKALGLGYYANAADVYLSLGARSLRLPVLSSPRAALARPRDPLAYREKGEVLVPVKRVAEALGAGYTGNAASLWVTLPAARLADHYLVRGPGQEQLFLRFSRDVNLIQRAPGRFLVLGAEAGEAFIPLVGETLFGLELRPDPLGLELTLLGAETAPLRYAPVPRGVTFWIGPMPPETRRPRVVVDGGGGPLSQRVAKAVVARLRARGYQAKLGGGPSPAARAEAGTRADVFLVLSDRGNGAVYTYRPRGRALALEFVVRGREALLLGGAPRALSRSLAPAEASAKLAGDLARALGIGRGSAEIALLAWAPKAAAMIELPRGDPETLAAAIESGVVAYLGGRP